MKSVLILVLLMASFPALARSAFETTDITKRLADRDRAVQAERGRGFARLYDGNLKLLNSIPLFAREHRGLATEPTCNSQNWRCTNGPCVPTDPEPWNPHQPLSSINLNSVMAIMNCHVEVNDGWKCVLNWYGPERGTAGLTFHCNRDGYRKDFTVKGTRR